MPARPHQSFARTAALAGAGVAGLATLFVAPAVAHAAPAPAGDSTTAATPGDAPRAKVAAPVEEVEADYGYQKYRVGVRGKDGDFFPDGTSTADTQLHVVETGPTGTVRRDFLCNTKANDPDTVDKATFCEGDHNRQPPLLSRKAAAANEPTPDDVDLVFTAQPGSTVTVTQQTVKADLLIDSSTATLKPCELGPNPFDGLCGTNNDEGSNDDYVATSTDLVLVDPGIPPVATNDSAKTKEGVAVTIAIAPNDDSKQAPLDSVAIVGDPKNGTAKLITAESSAPPAQGRQAAGSRTLAAVTSYRAIYTPKAGFTGVDTFRYTIATANGTATATVRVTVTGLAAAPSETAGTGVSANTDDRNDLADTGTQSGDLIGYGAALLAAGAGALAIGQQRRRGRHAR